MAAFDFGSGDLAGSNHSNFRLNAIAEQVNYFNMHVRSLEVACNAERGFLRLCRARSTGR
jgi:hypothetical protein